MKGIPMALVLGVDSSTQATKALLVDADSGDILDERRAPHPDGTAVDPRAWLRAFDEAAGPLLPRAQALAIGGQQHGMVALDEREQVIRPALLWNDNRSARAARDLNDELGGPRAAAERTGSVTVASLTSSKLRWMRDAEPDNARRTARVVLPHDYVTAHVNTSPEWVTDRGDASGTGYFSPLTGRYDTGIQSLALGHEFEAPRIAGVHEVVGETENGAAIAAGTGDNMAAALGLGLRHGEVSLSIGTSGVAAMVTDAPVVDPSGAVNSFADATGRWLPLACTLNASRILDFGCQILGVGYDELGALALQSVPGARGAIFVPYLDGERTPQRPNATGSFVGLTRKVQRADMARAVIEGLLCSLADALHFLEDLSGTAPKRIMAIGGGIKSPAVRALAPTVFGCDISVPEPREYVALGAARQAAWALSGADEPPQWPEATTTTYRAEHEPHVLAAYQDARG